MQDSEIDQILGAFDKVWTLVLWVINNIFNFFNPDSVLAKIIVLLFSAQMITFYFILILFYPILFWGRQRKLQRGGMR